MEKKFIGTSIFLSFIISLGLNFWGSSYVDAFHLFKYTKPKTVAEKEHAKAHAEAKDPLTRAATSHELKKLSIKDINMGKAFNFDPGKGEKGEITYTISEPALMSIRVVRKTTRELFLATILNWEYRTAGTHTEKWDGRDYHGKIVDLSKIIYFMEGEPVSNFAPGTMTKGVEYKEGLSQEQLLHLAKFGHTHGKHSLSAEEIPILNINSPKDGETLKGLVTVKALMDKKARGYGDKYGYGVRYYIDEQLINEEFYKPESGGNFSYNLDTTAFEDGKHILYMGVCDHNEHVTSQGLEVTIDNSK